MRSFIDNNTDGNRTFLLYGDLADIFYPASIEMEFEELLHALLKSRGYEYIIFYGNSGNKGKHCFDEASAKRFFADVPAGTSSSPAASSAPEISVQPQTRRKRITRHQNVANTETEVPESDNQQASPVQEENEPQENTNGRAVRYSQLSIANSEFYREVTGMVNAGEKFAVVFYNLFEFLNGDGTERQFLDQIVALMDRPSSNALCIFEAPSDPSIEMICDALRGSSLRYKFISSVSGNTLRRFNCFHIGAPGEDEVKHLLQRYSTKSYCRKDGCLPLSFDYNKIDIYAHLLLQEANRSSSDETSMLRIKLQLLKWLKSHKADAVNGKIPFNDLSPSEVFGRTLSEKEIRERRTLPIEKLNVKGWESVYTHIKRIVEMQKRRGIIAPDTKPDSDVCVNRLAGLSSVGDNIGSHKIPNFVITGNPGTGKTVIGSMLADILYAENILPTSKCLPVGKADLTSSLIAGIPQAVMRCANRAEGGVLMIDEAPQLADEDGGVNNEGSGPEIVQTLNRIMTDPTRHICVVLTGYQEGMEKLFKIDPGFRSRFGGNEIHIEDYKPPLLTEILRNSVKNVEGIEYSFAPDVYSEELSTQNPDVKQPLEYYMEHLYQKRDRRTFGNARDMKNLAAMLAAAVEDSTRTEIRRSDFYGPAPFCPKDAEEPDVVDESWFLPINPEESMDKLIEDIENNYVGLSYLVERFRQIEARVKETAMLEGQSVIDKMRMRSFVLVGNPGTGKDVVAHLLARLLRILGVLNNPDPIVKDGGDLASRYLGGSVEEAKKWVKEAQERNALLFINEAHQLLDKHMDGKGALQTFIAPMTNKTQFIACFAVYPKEKEKFFKLDNGLESRLEVIELPDYTDVELFNIFQIMCRKQRLDCSAVLPTVSKICLRLYREHQPNDGNARLMENLILEMNDRRISRCNAAGIPFSDENNSPHPDRLKLLPEDIPESWLVRLPERGCDTVEKSDFEEIRHALEFNVVGRHELLELFQALADEEMEAKMLRESGISGDFWPRPIILAGNPGSGKTMIGRLLAKLYNMLGLVRSCEPHHFDASELASEFANGVRTRIEHHLSEARERKELLFVDEAHQLLSLNDGTGAVQALLAPMNNPDLSKRVVIVLAVYNSELNSFLAMDDGLHRRLKIINLRDYTGSELKMIFIHMATAAHVRVSEELSDLLSDVCDKCAFRQQIDPKSGNAGMMEVLLEKMNARRRERCRRTGIAIGATDDYLTLLPEDVPEEYLSAPTVDPIS